MAKKYNTAHLICTFKVEDIVTMAIPAKNQVVDNTSKMEVYIIEILYENRNNLQTKYGILTNSYLTSKLN